jgi:Dynamin family
MASSHRSGPLPCLALCGEFSAGKSSIINLLLGCDMLPTSVLSSTRRPTYLRFAPELRIEAISESGERDPVSVETISTLSREDISHFDVGMPSELLRHVELLDTPGFADPFHDHQRTLDAVEGANICIWCTLATQAWRESEHQTWLSLPSHFQANGILVVTHVDTLTYSGEQQRVRTRLGREAGDLFGEIVLLSVPDAMRAMRGGGITDPGLWQDSGGGALVAALEKVVTGYHAARRTSPDETTETPWTGLGFQPVEFMIATAAPQPEAPQEALAPAASDVACEPVALLEPQRFLARVMETVPACLATAWIDLAKHEILMLRENEPGETTANTVLGNAITDLFQAANVQRMEEAFNRARGLSEDGGPYLR